MSTSERSKSSWVLRLIQFVSFACLGAAAATTWYLVVVDSQQAIAQDRLLPSRSILTELSTRSRSATSTLHVEVAEAPVLAGFPGVVAQIEAEPVDLAEDGDNVIAHVDGWPVIASTFATTTTFHRDLDRGDEGSDVALLRRVLQSRSFEAGQEGTGYDSQLESALAAWLDSLGAENPEKAKLRLGQFRFVPWHGEFIPTASLGDVVAEGQQIGVLRTSTPEFHVFVSAEQFSWIELGHLVRGPEFDGVVGSMDGPILVDGVETYRVGVESNSPGFGDRASSIDVTISPAPEQAVWIPSASIGQSSDGMLFVVLASGEERTVARIDRLEGEVRVEGLEPGTEIVVPNPQLFASDSVR